MKKKLNDLLRQQILTKVSSELHKNTNNKKKKHLDGKSYFEIQAKTYLSSQVLTNRYN